LITKKEFREESRDKREIESLSIAQRALTISKWAIVVSIITAIITVCLTFK